MAKHPRPEFLANINPANARSIRMFEKMGFGHIQNTYRLEAS
jgi:L-amino acid N-acyltransferase YncA